MRWSKDRINTTAASRAVPILILEKCHHAMAKPQDFPPSIAEKIAWGQSPLTVT
jgi:hypothetical protein